MKHIYLFLACVLTAGVYAQVEPPPPVMPAVGAHYLRIIAPTVLELVRINTKAPDPARVDSWDFFNSTGQYQAPPLSSFEVRVNGSTVSVQSNGFRRRPLYAPNAKRDLRIENSIYLKLTNPLSEGQWVEVRNPSGTLWPSTMLFRATNSSMRLGPAVHVNQEGYMPGYSKKAMVGYYLGNLGELTVSATTFTIRNAATGTPVFTNTLTARPDGVPDGGFGYTPAPYQNVWEADFSSFNTPGEYVLSVPGLGSSYAFTINDGIAMGFTRAYALGLYHQRCGTHNVFPYTRHTHGVCHTNLAEVPMPQSSFAFTWNKVAEKNADAHSSNLEYNQPVIRHTAPRLTSPSSARYGYSNLAPVNVSGGHHDAGDYSKYTINSAGLIHYLTFAADSFTNAGTLDNFGLPESGDGKSDLLQEAKWEADFLAKMQDSDGGFYFLVYPKTREYEDNVTPDKGDSQVVWPKTTAVTAAAVGALAELGSSPRFKQQFPAAAAIYLQKAQLGWKFLTNAIAIHGRDGSYQKITHYGDNFMHDDELAWAAAAMYVATTNSYYHTKLMEWYDPSASNTRRWTWWRLFEGYGCAARTYAFAARSGRLSSSHLNSGYLTKCEQEIKGAGTNAWDRYARNAYGTSYPFESKSNGDVGWYFSSERAFDMTVAYHLEAQSRYMTGIIANLNYEAGNNPINMSYVTGTGWKRQREIVHQYAQNDIQMFPPTGIPIGNLQRGFVWTETYKTELGALVFPFDGGSPRYPIYDRWSDAFNTETEFVHVDVARSLASLSFLAAATPLRTQSWAGAVATISSPTSVPINVPATNTISSALNLAGASVLWEGQSIDPAFGSSYVFVPTNKSEYWVQAEAALPDGRRVFAANSIVGYDPVNGGVEYSTDSNTVALYHFSGNFADSSGHGHTLQPVGNAILTNRNQGWMKNPSGAVARFFDLGDALTVSLPDNLVLPTGGSLTVEAKVYVRKYKAWNRADAGVVYLYQAWNSYLGFIDPQTPDDGVTVGGKVVGNGVTLVSTPNWKTAVPENRWHSLRITLDSSGVARVYVNGNLLNTVSAPPYFGATQNWILTLGNFDGDIDEVRISNTLRSGDEPVEPPTGGCSFTPDANTIALYQLDGNAQDSSGNSRHLSTAGTVQYVAGPSGQAARFSNAGDYLSVTIPDTAILPGPGATPITIEASIYPRAYKAWNVGNYWIVGLYQDWDAKFELLDGIYNSPAVPSVRSAQDAGIVSSSTWQNHVTLNAWHKLRITFSANGVVECYIDDVLRGTATVAQNYGRTGNWTFTLGNFDGDIDQVRISNTVRGNCTGGGSGSCGLSSDGNTTALYKLDGNAQDTSGNNRHLTTSGNVQWVTTPCGQGARFGNANDYLSVSIADSAIMPGSAASPLTIEASVFPRAYKAWNVGNFWIIGLFQDWDAKFEVLDGIYNSPAVPSIKAAQDVGVLSSSQWQTHVPLNAWSKIKLTFGTDGIVRCYINDVLRGSASAPANYGRTSNWGFTLGNFDGDIDEVRISNSVR